MVSLWAIFNGIGTLGFNLYYPESLTLGQVLAKARHHLEFHIYHLGVLAWLVVNVLFPGNPSMYVPSTILLMVMLLIHPTRLFWLAKRKSKTQTRDMLTILQTAWVSFVAVIFFLFALGVDNPPLLGATLPFAWEFAFLTGSVFFLFMSKAVASPSGMPKTWGSLLVPETLVKLGQRYLILHDAGEKARSLLSASLKNLIEAGARVVVTSSTQSQLLDSTFREDQKFKRWEKQGRLIAGREENEKSNGGENRLEKLVLAHSGTVYVTELEGGDLGKTVETTEDKSKTQHRNSELFLLESSRVARPQLTEFLKANPNIQLLDFSTPRAPFSNMLNIPHSRLHGRTILLEFGSDTSIEETVQKFLTEDVSNGELCTVFTPKSSRLYRSIKGTKNIKIVSASSLVSAPDELPDGEVQIPNRELGLVTSIASDFLEANKNMPTCFVFDSLTEFIRGDRWEQIYSGIKQLIELVAVPDVTTLFLVNRDTADPHFLGALQSTFSALMRLDRSGLQLTKLTE